VENLLLVNGRVFDGISPDVTGNSILVENGRIREISDTPIKTETARVIDLKGRTLMPGLIDAHVHAYFPDVDPLKSERMPTTMVAHRAGRMFEASLARGFTAVRDTGGADYGLYLAIERGWVNGPRLFYCGRGLSQTGGHGDMRRPHEHDPHEHEICTCGMSHAGRLTAVVDGVDNLRRAVREEMRRGAHFIKIMGSGGVSSTGDSLHCAQYAEDEVRAVVDEVERHDSYVTAHCHPDGAIRRCIELGIHCIEHGTMISEETAAFAAARGTDIVPTLAVISALSQHGARLGYPPESLEKLAEIAPTALTGVERMMKAGVRIGFGTDLIGELDRHQCIEFTLRREIMSPFEILRSATSVNADIIRAGNRIGRIAPNYLADLIVVDGDPLDDVSLFTEDGRNVPLVIKGGKIAKSLM